MATWPTWTCPRDEKLAALAIMRKMFREYPNRPFDREVGKCRSDHTLLVKKYGVMDIDDARSAHGGWPLSCKGMGIPFKEFFNHISLILSDNPTE